MRRLSGATNVAGAIDPPQWPVFTFLPVALVVLAADSHDTLPFGMPGRPIANLVTAVYLLAILSQASARLRGLILLTVPLSLMAEVICSHLLGLYSYRLDLIPLYVPLGHGVIFGTGWTLDHSPLVAARPRLVRVVLTIGFALLLGVAVFARNDTLSAILGAGFFALLVLAGWPSFYLVMGILVLAVEVIGTSFGCWAWHPRALGVVSAANPPVGAIAFYVYGDLVVVRCYRALVAGATGARRRLRVEFSLGLIDDGNAELIARRSQAR